MKLLTLNTHSLQETNYSLKLDQFVSVIKEEQPDILALQEVNQSMDAPPADSDLLSAWVPCPDSVPIRNDNHGAQTALRLRKMGIPCSYTWISAKIGYGKYDEGMALFSLNHKITEVHSFFISGCRDYDNWKTRRVLGIRTDASDDWFYTAHMGWWQDEEEPFSAQWNRLNDTLQPKKENGTVWLMGDFNSPSQFRGQGYDQILESGWADTYELAAEKDSGITVEGCIDGWKSYYDSTEAPKGMRIDHIWCSHPVSVKRSRVLFNGNQEPKVSDHFGVMIEI